MEGLGVFFFYMIRLFVRGKSVRRERSETLEVENITPSKKEYEDNLKLNVLMAFSCLNAVFSQLGMDRI